MKDKKCPKCDKIHSKKGIYCSYKCSNSRKWTEADKLKKSESAKKSEKVRLSNSNEQRRLKYLRKRVYKICPVCGCEFSLTESRKNRVYCSKKCYLNDTEKNEKFKTGGLRKGSGRGKSGWYKGIWCDSSWELAWVIYNLEHNIPFERNWEKFEYEFEGKTHYYLPDFKMEDGLFIEVKGYMDKKNKAKITNFEKPLKVILGKKENKIYIDYAKEKYGNDFIKLYEGNPHNERKNKCLVCGKPAKNQYCSRACSGKGARKRNF